MRVGALSRIDPTIYWIIPTIEVLKELYTDDNVFHYALAFHESKDISALVI
jgi:hypothetical protein